MGFLERRIRPQRRSPDQSNSFSSYEVISWASTSHNSRHSCRPLLLLLCMSSGGRSLPEGENVWRYPIVHCLLQFGLVVLDYAQVVASPFENGVDNRSA